MEIGIAGSPVRDGLMLAIIAGGMTSGAIDIAYAIVASGAKGVAPAVVLQSVASGLLGKAAYAGGAAAALLGAMLHFAMTVAMAAIFVAAVRRSALLAEHWAVAGVLYGALIYFAMRLLVVPLSRFPGTIPINNWAELAVHAFGVGLPIAFFARRLAGPLPELG